MYEHYAEVFAASPHHREYNERLAAFLPEFLRRLGIAGQTVLDVACGVGDLAMGLAQRGYSVTGVDLAPAMIEIARQRATAAGLPIRFEVADMRALGYAEAFDLALCFGDSLNYMLTPADFRLALRSMHTALVPGGWLIFDLLTDDAIETFYANQAYILQNTDLVFEVHENDYEPDTEVGTLTLTAFMRRPDGAYERVQEVHHQRGYAPDLVHDWALAAGFADLTWFTDWEIAEPVEDEDGQPSRVFCACRTLAEGPQDGERDQVHPIRDG